MNKRKLFNYPISKSTKELFYPDKLNSDEFKREITNSIKPFIINMINLGKKYSKQKYIEEWFELYLDWLDIELEKKETQE